MPQPFIQLVPSASRTAAGNGERFDLAAILGVNLQVGLPPCFVFACDVTAVSGTSPTMTCILEDSTDGGVTWNTVLSLTAQTAISRQVGRLGLTAASWPFNPRCCRIRWTMGGTTPNFTFRVTGVLL